MTFYLPALPCTHCGEPTMIIATLEYDFSDDDYTYVPYSTVNCSCGLQLPTHIYIENLRALVKTALYALGTISPDGTLLRYEDRLAALVDGYMAGQGRMNVATAAPIEKETCTG